MTTEELLAFRTWLASHDALAGVTIQAGPLLPSPDRQIAVMDYPGPQTPNWRADYRCQIRVRSERSGPGISPFGDAHQLADAVIAIVAPPGDDEPLVDLGDGRIAIVRLVSGPLSLGPDENGRWELTINVALDVSRV